MKISKKFVICGIGIIFLAMIFLAFIQLRIINKGNENRVKLSYQPILKSTNCVKNAKLIETCLVTFDELLFSAKELSGKQVKLIGFLAIDDGSLSLFSSEAAYENRDKRLSVRLRGSRSMQESLFNKYAYKIISINAIFVAADKNYNEGVRLGVMKNITRVYDLPSKRVREGVIDLGINVEDLDVK